MDEVIPEWEWQQKHPLPEASDLRDRASRLFFAIIQCIADGESPNPAWVFELKDKSYRAGFLDGASHERT